MGTNGREAAHEGGQHDHDERARKGSPPRTIAERTFSIRHDSPPSPLRALEGLTYPYRSDLFSATSARTADSPTHLVWTLPSARCLHLPPPLTHLTPGVVQPTARTGVIDTGDQQLVALPGLLCLLGESPLLARVGRGVVSPTDTRGLEVTAEGVARNVCWEWLC
jgi:hypothetical protein